MSNSVVARGPSRPKGDGLGKRMARFLRESYIEVVKKASWPSRADLQKMTIVVIIAVIIVAAYIGVMDGILSRITHPLLGGPPQTPGV